MNRLFATIHAGKPVGIYDTGSQRLLVKYENPTIDALGRSDYAFENDYGCHGVEAVLAEYIRKLVNDASLYDTKCIDISLSYCPEYLK